MNPLLVVPVIAALAFLLGAVDFGGALAGALVGGAMATASGWGGIAMLLAFVLLGTAASPRRERRRDAVQVLCNGGAAATAALLGSAAGAAGALAAALSDTLSGEMGKRWGGPARRLLFGRRTAKGADGGMTLLGTAAGAAAAFVVPAVGIATEALRPSHLLPVAVAGFLGNVADSVLGAFVQPRLGRRGNDAVNLLATAAGAFAAAFPPF